MPIPTLSLPFRLLSVLVKDIRQHAPQANFLAIVHVGVPEVAGEAIEYIAFVMEAYVVVVITLSLLGRCLRPHWGGGGGLTAANLNP